METQRSVLPEAPPASPRPSDPGPEPGAGAARSSSWRPWTRRWAGQRPGRPSALIAGACWLVIAGLTALTALRATGWDGLPFAPALVAFVPWAALLAPCLLVAAVALRRRGLGLAALLLVVVHVAWLAPRFTAEPVPDAPPDARLRVMSVNALGQFDPGPLLAAVREERPDLLVLTEVPPEVLASYEAAGLRDLLPDRVDRPAPRAAGTAIYARAALRLADAGDPGGDTTFENPRGTVQLAGRTVTVQAAHPPPPAPYRAAIRRWRHDLGLLTKATSATTGPQLAIGDFNASADHAPFRELLAGGGLRDAHDTRGRGLVTTWPVGDRDLPPFVHIDHVLVSRDFAVLAVHELEVPRLDHRAVVADLALLPR